MNEPNEISLAQMERELRSLSPMKVEPQFLSRLEQAMDAPAASAVARRASAHQSEAFTARRWVPWAAAAAVTAIATPVYFNSRSAAPSDKPAGLPRIVVREASRQPAPLVLVQPPSVVPTIQGMEDHGIVFDVDEGPVRRVQYNITDQYHYRNADGSKLEIHVPRRKEVREPIIY